MSPASFVAILALPKRPTEISQRLHIISRLRRRVVGLVVIRVYFSTFSEVDVPLVHPLLPQDKFTFSLIFHSKSLFGVKVGILKCL